MSKYYEFILKMLVCVLKMSVCILKVSESLNSVRVFVCEALIQRKVLEFANPKVRPLH